VLRFATLRTGSGRGYAFGHTQNQKSIEGRLHGH
jgi:hypothetical protein